MCQSSGDCPIVHCECSDGIVNYSACNYGQCGTAADCPGVCGGGDEGEDGGDGDGDGGDGGDGGDTDW
jgi:hypothetical protein